MRKVRLSKKAVSILKSHKKPGMSYSDVVFAMFPQDAIKKTKMQGNLVRWAEPRLRPDDKKRA